MTRHDRVSYRHGRVSLTAPQYKKDFIRKLEDISDFRFWSCEREEGEAGSWSSEAQGRSISSRGFASLTSLVVILRLICIMCIWFMNFSLL